MKDIMYFYLRGCPYCHRADDYINQLTAENPEYAKIKISRVEESENAAAASLFDYYYVPCFYVDGVKKLEGAVSKADVKAALDSALE